MLYNVTVYYKAFPQNVMPGPMQAQANGATVDEALEDIFRAFNHAFPGRTGELAEKYKVRSMCVGDEVQVGADRWLCAGVGFVNLTEHPEMRDDPMVKMHTECRE
jgi:hypothetical protein